MVTGAKGIFCYGGPINIAHLATPFVFFYAGVNAAFGGTDVHRTTRTRNPINTTCRKCVPGIFDGTEQVVQLIGRFKTYIYIVFL